jgi:hypothetical protein
MLAGTVTSTVTAGRYWHCTHTHTPHTAHPTHTLHSLTHCPHTVHTLHTLHTLHTYCTHTARTLHTHPTHTAHTHTHTLHTHCTHTAHTHTHTPHTHALTSTQRLPLQRSSPLLPSSSLNGSFSTARWLRRKRMRRSEARRRGYCWRRRKQLLWHSRWRRRSGS